MARQKKTDSAAKAETAREAAAAKKTEAADREAMLNMLDSYDLVEVHRSELKPHPKNPRTISQRASTRLQHGLEKFGLLGPPIIVNRITGYMIGGHQRLASIDRIKQTKDYRLRVAMVELSERDELAAMIFLNNSATQGDWELEKLEALYAEDHVSVEDSGFSMAEMYQLFGDNPLVGQDDELANMAEQIRASKERVAEMQEKLESDPSDDVDYYAVVVFESDDDRDQFCDTLDADENRYVDGRELWALLHSSDAVEMDLVKGCFRTTIRRCQRCGKTHLETVVWPLSNPVDKFDHWAFCFATCQPVLVARADLPDSEVTMIDVPDEDEDAGDTAAAAAEHAAVAEVAGSGSVPRDDGGRQIENT